MAILGIDFGKKKIGLAISEGEIASPLEILFFRDRAEILDKIDSIFQENRIKEVVIGLPEKTASSKVIIQEINNLSDQIKDKYSIPVFFQPEVFTTQEAKKKLLEAGKGKKRRGLDDDIAAALILQSFLNKRKK